jgi:hypothetical protein
MNPVDRVVEKHFRLIGDIDTVRGQELAMKEIDLSPAAASRLPVKARPVQG